MKVMQTTLAGAVLRAVVLLLAAAGLLALAGPPTPAAAQGECGPSYQVARGDALSKIARRCGTTVSALMAANPQIQSANRIMPGQTLQIPDPDAPAAAIPTGTPEPIPSQSGCTASYQVARGDSLSKIARRCGTTMSSLMMANPQIKAANRIFPGQTVRIPQKPVPVSDGSPTVVVRPEADRLTEAELDGLGVEAGERWIDVDLSSQTVSAYEGRDVVQTFLASTGTYRTPTVTGQFAIYQRFEKDDMRGPGYFLEDVPYTMYFHKSYGLHGTFWHDNFGQPMSHGCVNLSVEDARWLFEFAAEGTRVNVHY